MSFAEFMEKGLFWLSGSKTVAFIGVTLCVILPYLLGSVSFSVIISRKRGTDVREKGSGNAGATNMLRSFGIGSALLTLALDILKGALSAGIGFLFMPADGGGYIAAVACIIGHAFPVFFDFKGGKGVAVAAGAVAVLNPLAFAVLAVIFALIVLLSRYVSLASVVCALLFPILNILLCMYFTPSLVKLLAPFVIAALIVYFHRKNITRLVEGGESKINFGRSKNNEKNQKK